MGEKTRDSSFLLTLRDNIVMDKVKNKTIEIIMVLNGNDFLIVIIKKEQKKTKSIEFLELVIKFAPIVREKDIKTHKSNNFLCLFDISCSEIKINVTYVNRPINHL